MRAAGDGRQHRAIAAPAVRGLEHAADHALLPPHGAGRKLAVGRQAGQLGAGAGAAGRAVVGLAGTEHEAAAVGVWRRREELDVVDLGAVAAGDAVGGQRLAYAPGGVGQRLDLVERNWRVRPVDEEEPVAAPGDITADDTEPRYLDRHGLVPAVRRHVLDRDALVVVQGAGDRADDGIDAVHAGRDAAEVAQGFDHADRAVAAHADVADIVEVDHRRHRTRLLGRAEPGADQHAAAARLARHRRADGIVLQPPRVAA